MRVSAELAEKLIARGHARSITLQGTQKARAAKAPKTNEGERKFAFDCLAVKLPTVVAQFKFPVSIAPHNSRRRWRCDFCFPDWMLMVEIDGGLFIRGAHGNPVDIARNMRKQNDATLLGYQVLRFQPREVVSGHAITVTEKALRAKGWKS